MSVAPTEFESLLREALDKATEEASQASKDLHHFASEAADAVSRVSGGMAILELVPIGLDDGRLTTYQLQLRRDGSEAPPSDLGVFRLSDHGYPVFRWYSLENWDARPGNPDNQHPDDFSLRGNFRWMVSKPESKLVVLVNSLRPRPSSG